MSFLVDPAVLQSVADELEAARVRATDDAIKAAEHTIRNGSSSSSSSSSSTTPPTPTPTTTLLPISEDSAASLEYAKLAIFSSHAQTSAAGIAHLLSLASTGYKPSEIQFWIAVGYMNTGAFSQARHTLAWLVRNDPSNERAAALLEIFKSKVQVEGKQGMMGILGVGVVVAVIVGVTLYAWWRGGNGRGGGGDRVISNNNAFEPFPPTSSSSSSWRGSSGSGSSGSSNNNNNNRYGRY